MLVYRIKKRLVCPRFKKLGDVAKAIGELEREKEASEKFIKRPNFWDYLGIFKENSS